MSKIVNQYDVGIANDPKLPPEMMARAVQALQDHWYLISETIPEGALATVAGAVLRAALQGQSDPRSGERDVSVHLDIPDNQLGMAPNTGLALRMSPTEARRFADVLRRKADEAEVGLPRA